MIQKAIAIIVLLLYFILMFLGKTHRNTLYIGFILIAFPFMGIDLMPSMFSLRIFDFISITFLILFYKKRKKVAVNQFASRILSFSFFMLIAVFVFNTFIGRELNASFYVSSLQLFTVTVFAKIVFDEFVHDENLLSRIIPWFRFMLLFSLLFLLMQLFFGTAFTFSKSPNINIDGGIVTRFPAYFQDPQKYAQFLAALSFPVLLVSHKENKYSMQGICLFVLALIALLYTGGRAALLGWVAGFFILMIFTSKRFKFILLGLLLILIYAGYQFQDYLPILKRASIGDSYAFRNEIWHDAFKIFLKYPLTGIGFGEYANYVSVHHPDQFWIQDNDVTYFDHPESGYLKLLVEFGLFGFLPLIVLMIYPVINGFKIYFKNLSTIHLLFSISLITWIIGFSTVYSLGDIRIAILITTISAYQIAFSSAKNTIPND
jgi:O-antigen ligase